MTSPVQKSPDVDSAGVYFISVEDFEARAKPKRPEPDARRDPGERPGDDPQDAGDQNEKDLAGAP
jgi:hypothetical protein